MKFLFHMTFYFSHIKFPYIKNTFFINFDFTYEIIYFIYVKLFISRWRKQSFPYPLSIFRLKDLCVSQLTRKLPIFNLFLNFYKVRICYPGMVLKPYNNTCNTREKAPD